MQSLMICLLLSGFCTTTTDPAEVNRVKTNIIIIAAVSVGVSLCTFFFSLRAELTA
jgi:hypothetical protein